MASDHRAHQVLASRLVLKMHNRMCVREAVCRRRLRPYPCVEVRWAGEILAYERANGGLTGVG